MLVVGKENALAYLLELIETRIHQPKYMAV